MAAIVRLDFRCFSKMLKKFGAAYWHARLRIALTRFQYLAEPRPRGSGPAAPFFSILF